MFVERCFFVFLLVKKCEEKRETYDERIIGSTRVNVSIISTQKKRLCDYMCDWSRYCVLLLLLLLLLLSTARTKSLVVVVVLVNCSSSSGK